MLTQAIASAVDFTCDHHPDVAEQFARKLAHFESCLKRLHLSDEELARLRDQRLLLWQTVMWLMLGLMLLPVAAYGWLHRALPILMVNEVTKRMAQFSHGSKTHISTTAILAGTVSFGVCYAVYITFVHALFGFPVSLWYALSLPVTGLVAHWYLRGIHHFVACLHCAYVRCRAPVVGQHLVALRNELIAQIESARWQVPVDALKQQPSGFS